jgi:hypothetical protein
VLMFSNPIVGGTTLIREAIRSPNYVAGSSGWSINRDGTVEFASGTFRGSINIPATGGGSTQINAGWITLTDAPSAGAKAAVVAINGSSIPSFRSLLITSPATAFVYACTIQLCDDGTIRSQGTFQSQGTVNVTSGDLQRNAYFGAGPSYGGAKMFANWSANGFTELAGITSNGKFWSWNPTTNSWADANFVASNVSGGSSTVSMRTNPLASQLRVGTAVQDIYFRDSVDSAYVSLQAAAFVIGSRLNTKRDVEPLPHDGLAVVRRMRPIRYVQRDHTPLLCDPADEIHQAPAALRGATPLATMANLAAVREQSATHLGFTVDELAELIPEAIHHGEDGEPSGYDLAGVVAVLVHAVQQLAERVDAGTGGR